MLERDVKRKYFLELGLAIAAYAIALVLSLQIAQRMDETALRTLLLLTPAIPVFLLVWVLARQFRRLDEFVRLRSLESVAVAAAVTAGLSLTYGFLESAGFPRLSMFWVWTVMGGTWALHSALRGFFAR